MATPGYQGSIEVNTTDSFPGTSVGGANSVSGPFSRAMLDITDFDDTAVNRIAGLNDSSLTISGHEDYADAGQDILRAAVLSGATIYAQMLPDGTNGFKFTCKVESYEPSNAPDGTPQFSCSLQGVAVVAAVP